MSKSIWNKKQIRNSYLKQKFALFGSYYLAYYYHHGGITKEIMTNPSGDRDTISLSGLRGGGGSGKMACHPGLRLGQQTIFPDPPESLESNSITCHPLDQSLFVYYHAHLSLELYRVLQ